MWNFTIGSGSKAPFTERTEGDRFPVCGARNEEQLVPFYPEHRLLFPLLTKCHDSFAGDWTSVSGLRVGEVSRPSRDTEVFDSRRTEKAPEFVVQPFIRDQTDILSVRIAGCHNAEFIGQLPEIRVD
jgi:hypothetical protein